MRAGVLPTVAILILVTLSVEPPLAQQPSSVRGRVIAGDTGEPVVNARVAVSGTMTAVRTGIDGRFTIAAPPTATLLVTKAGFVRAEHNRGTSTQANSQPVEVKLVRAAVLTGRVVNEFGEPVVGAAIRIAGSSAVGTLPLGPVRAATDDRGVYRIGGLAADAYVVAVMTQGSGPMTLERSSQGPLTTFFPGTFEQNDAIPVRLAPGEEGTADFHLTVAQTARQPFSVFPSIVSMRDLTIPTGSASIHGTIVSSDGQPLPHAVVVLTNDAASTYRTAMAGDDARYEFTAVAPGRYRVAASKPGYSLPSDGFTLPQFLRAGTRVAVAADEDRDRVDVTLLPWGVINGRVLDEVGEPISGVGVGLLLSRYEGGRRRLVPARTPARATTDDRGEFRIYGIPSGQYLLGASINDNPTLDVSGYGPTYYPGTAAAGEARFITIEAGDDLTGLDFNMVPAATARITGRLIDAAGRPTTGGQFTLVSRSALGARLNSRIGTDGVFEFINVPPGQYVIQADRGRREGNVEGEFGALPVTVNRTDVSGLILRTSLGSTIQGRIVTQSTTSAAPPPRSIGVSAIPGDFDLAPPSLADASPDENGVFELRGINGQRRLQLTRLPPGWMVKSIVSDGRDVTDQLLEFGRPNQSIVPVEVVLTDQVNVVAGTVTDDRARRLAGARVVIFSADRAQWYPASRFVRSAETGDDGSFSISGLPTGSYFVVSVMRTPAGDEAWRDPAFLDQVRPGATSIALGEGQTQTINVRVSSR